MCWDDHGCTSPYLLRCFFRESAGLSMVCPTIHCKDVSLKKILIKNFILYSNEFDRANINNVMSDIILNQMTKTFH